MASEPDQTGFIIFHLITLMYAHVYAAVHFGVCIGVHSCTLGVPVHIGVCSCTLWCMQRCTQPYTLQLYCACISYPGVLLLQ